MDYAAWGIRVHTAAPGAFPTGDMPLHNVAGADAERLAHTLATRPRELVLDRIRSALPDLDTTRSSP